MQNAEILPKLSPQTLTQICRTWRLVALGTPSLWRNVYIDQNTKLAMTEIWIERSKAVPLDVCVELVDTSKVEHARRIAALLAPHAERWRVFRWSSSLGLEEAFTAISGKKAPLLEVLSLDDRSFISSTFLHPYHDQKSRLFGGPGSTPRLRVVEHWRVPTSWIEHPLRNLTSLDLACPLLGWLWCHFQTVLMLNSLP